MATASLTTLSTKSPSHLQAAEWAFTAITAEPACLSLDSDALSAAAGHDLGLPAGAVSLSTLRTWLRAHPDNNAARDAVWRELVLRARLQGGHWRLAAVGMALPGLRKHASILALGYRGEPADVETEVLAGFLTGLDGQVDLAQPAPYARLLRAGFKAGHRLRQQDDPAEPVEDIEAVAAAARAPRRPYGHPDLLVRRAVALGVIAAQDEQPFITVKLGGKAIEPIAAQLGITVDCLRRRLERAGDRLAAALADGLLTDGPVPEAAKARAGKTASGRRSAPVADLPPTDSTAAMMAA
jgi:hypothetical protein